MGAHLQLHDCGGVRLAVHTRGGGSGFPPVLLVHGTGGDASTWDVVAEDLARDRTVHAIDLRGHGASDQPGTYSIDLMAADLAALLPRLGQPLDLVGHSLGGLVCCRALADRPLGVRRLVLEDVGVLRPRAPAVPARPEGDLVFDWAVVEQVRPEIDAPAEHWPDTFGRVAVPTLVVGGGPSSFVPQEHVADLAALLPEGSHATLDTGHEVHATRPAEFLALLRGFLG